MDNRKREIVSHLARYRFSLKTVIEEQIIGGDASRDLHELHRNDLIQVHQRILGGGRTVYQLTQRAAREEGLPVSIATPPGPQGLLANLSLLWFCFCAEQQRNRLNDADQDKLLGDDSPRIDSENKTPASLVRYHILDTNNGRMQVCRVYVPSPRTKIADIERTLYGIVNLAEKRSKAKALLDAGTYAVVVLLQNEQRRQKLRQFLHRPHRLHAKPVPSLIPVRIELVPDFLRPNSPGKGKTEDVE